MAWKNEAELEADLVAKGAVVTRARLPRTTVDEGPLFRGKGWTEPVTLMLPWPPSINHYRMPVVMGKSARLITSKAGRAYQEAVAIVVRTVIPKAKFVEPVAVEVVLHPPTKNKADIDNFLKAAFDSLTKAGLLHDDSLIRHLTVSFGKVIPGGALMVSLRLMTDAERLENELAAARAEIERLKRGEFTEEEYRYILDHPRRDCVLHQCWVYVRPLEGETK